MYLNILILCGILPQVIIGNFANQEIRKSLDPLLRRKRVISHIPDEDKKVIIKEAPFMAHIKHLNRISCVASILSHYVVITIASCVPYENSQYNVLCKTSLSDRGTNHNVADIERHYGAHRNRPLDGIALLTVVPPFEYGKFLRNIELYSGPLLPGTIGTVYGWGFHNRTNDRGTRFPKHLRSINVPIMALWNCALKYEHHNVKISDQDICTYHTQRHCGHNDGGAPLVVDGKLAGVHLWTGPEMRDQVDPEYPDVFAVLQHYEYFNLIRRKINSMEGPHNHY